MKKRLILTIFALMFFNLSCLAEVLKAKVVTDFSTETPPETIVIQIQEDAIVEGFEVKKGYIVTGEIIDLIHPRAWGKNATFSLKLLQYVDESGIRHQIDGERVVKYRQKLKPNWERQSFSLMGSTDGGRTETGITFSPYDIKLMKESKNVGDFLWKDLTKDSMWQPGWELKYKQNETIYFNY